MTRTATNPQTGEKLYLDEQGSWQPTKTATNPATGQKAILKNGTWEALDRRQPSNPKPETPKTWGDVGSQAVDNFIPDAKQVAKDTIEPFLHPIDTAKNLYGIGKGVMQKLIPGVQEDEAKADAVGKFFMDNYGSVENIKKTLAHHPAQALTDLSMVLTGGGTMAARMPGVVGKAGKVIANAGNAIDPLTLAVKGAGKAGKYGGVAAKELLGATTGVGSDVIDSAYQSGKAGGVRGEHFKSNMMGNVDPLMVLEEARQGLDNMRHTRHRNYVKGSQEWITDKTPLKFDDIDNALTDLKKSMQTDTTNPHWSVSKNTQDTIQKIEDVIGEWKLDPELHTAGGFDALKRNIDDLMPNKLETGQSGRAVTQMRNAVKDMIVNQVPEYAKTMDDYEKAISLEQEIKRTLSIGGNPDTAMRKLQSMMRNNVNTNFGQRMTLGQQLEKHGGVNLMDRVAGQNVNKWAPRGLAQLGVTGAMLGTGFTGNPMGLALLPFQSPKAVGGGAYLAGKVAKGGKLTKQLLDSVGLTPQRARNALRGAYQEGRIDELTEQELSGLLGDK